MAKNKNSRSDLMAARLPLELAAQLRDYAAKSGSTISEVIITALREFFAREGGSGA